MAAAADVLEAAKAAVRGDLDLHEKGQRALVSYVRAYKEHQCSYIFQLDKVVAHMCGSQRNLSERNL